MRTLKYILLLPVLIGNSLGIIQAQNPDFGTEKVHLFADRTLYICGEEINFAAYLENQKDQSKILYLELILPDGSALVSHKYAVSDKQCQDKLEIPGNILSGNYYLKAYTKYMRGSGPAAFAYLPLKIVNPFISEFLTGQDQMVLDTVSPDLLQSVEAKNEGNGLFNIELPEKTKQLYSSFILDIVPANSYQKKRAFSVENSSIGEFYYPETMGLSLSGKIVDSISREPLPFREINLSIIDQKNFMSVRSNAGGRFYFALPDITGSHDVFISTKKENDVHPQIMVDIDFDNAKIQLPDPPFILSQEERSLCLKLAQIVQIQKGFTIKETENRVDTFLIPFYGKAERTLFLDNYISMGTLEEYFTELPGVVHIKNQNKEKSFGIFSTIHEMLFYPPLVLIDWVAVEDANRILAVSPHGIEKIEIVPYPWVYGDFIYGGIISILSRKGDFGGISLPTTGLFFNYDFIYPEQKTIYRSDLNALPDVQSNFYWKSYNQQNEIRNFDFKPAEYETNYWLIIQGVEPNGKESVEIHPIRFN